MEYSFAILLVLTSFAAFLVGLSSASMRVQLPFFVACVYLGWMAPQIVTFAGLDLHHLPSVSKLSLLALLSFGAILFGYGSQRRGLALVTDPPRNRAIVVAGTLTVAGLYFFIQVTSLEQAIVAEYGRTWTGVITIYFFLSQALSVGFATALLLYLRRPSRILAAMLLVATAAYLNRILFTGHRGYAVEFAIIVLLALWYARRWTPSKSVIVVLFLTGVVFVLGIHEYRLLLQANPHDTDLFAAVKVLFARDYRELLSRDLVSLEIYNAVMNIEGVDRANSYDFGLSLWNSLVRAFIPGQLLGFDIKSSLYLELDNPAYRLLGHVSYPGSTNTGFADAFASFWYFGFLIFYLIARIIKGLHLSAQRGSIMAAVIVMTTMPAALHSITHTSHHFAIKLLQVLAFLGVANWGARFLVFSNQRVAGR